MSKTAKIDLLPDRLDLALYAGDGATIQLQITDADGNSLDVSGEIKGQIRQQRTDTDALADWTVDMTNAPDGFVMISLTGDQTASLMTVNGNQFKGAWDVQWTPENVEPVTLLQGNVTCDEDVTR
jgi:hypothetical protein